MKKTKLYIKNKKRILKKIVGTQDKPRLSVFKSNKYIYAQIINDLIGHTLLSYNSLMLKKDENILEKKKNADLVGKQLGLKAKILGINKVVFDRGQQIYHGNIKLLAENAREYGLLF